MDTVRKRGPISRAELARLVGLTPPTVSSLITRLGRVGLVRDAQVGVAGRGRPPLLVEARDEAGHVIGLELGTSHLRAAIATLEGRPLDSVEEPRERYIGVGETLDKAKRLLNRLASTTGIRVEETLAISVAVPGIVDSERGEVILAKNLLGWHQVPLGRLLTETYQVPVLVENDFRCAALGEYAFGAAADQATFLFLGLCEGIGSALVVDGRLLRGHHFLAGEIGYMGTRLENVGDPSQERDYLESVVSISAIRERVSAALRRGRRSLLEPLTAGNGSEITWSRVLASAQLADPLAVETTDHVAKGLAFAIANIASVCDPALVVLGTDFGDSGEVLLEAVRRLVKEQLPSQPEIVLSRLGAGAILAGALYMAARTAENTILAQTA
jgi:predicted NBD/HSP70 family sugar kinase